MQPAIAPYRGNVREVEDVLDAIRAADWAQWDVPWVDYLWAYEPMRVVPAFESLAAVTTEAEGRRARDCFLNAVAHNHSGTPYPAIVDGVRHLVALIPLLDDWGAEAAVTALVDCYLFTGNDVDVRTIDGAAHDLTEVQRIAVTAVPFIRAFVEDHAHPAHAAATELLATIQELPPPPDAEAATRHS